MRLPDWTLEGYLPGGIHKTNWREISERCVLDSDDRQVRESMLGAVRAYSDRVRALIPNSKIWISGGLTSKNANTNPMSVVIFPMDWAAMDSMPESQQQQVIELLTLSDIIVGAIGYSSVLSSIPEISPLGGIIRGHLAGEHDEGYWTEFFTAPRFMEQDSNGNYGFMEVEL